MKTLLWPLAFLFAATVTITACDHLQDDEESVLLPMAVAQLDRTFLYTTSDVTETASYKDEKLLSGIVEEGNMVYANFTTGKDNLFFELDKSNLSSNLVGTYSLKSLPEPDAGITHVTYSYARGDNASTLLFSTANTIGGKFIITRYDAQNELISGRYEITIKNTHDPKEYYPNEAEAPACDVLVTGEFDNLKFNKL